jgi:hypothetical protein
MTLKKARREEIYKPHPSLGGVLFYLPFFLKDEG